MTVRYVTNGPWGAGGGSPLPAAYVDENFYTNVQAIDAAVASISSSVVSVVSANVTGDQLSFTLSDSTVLGPFTLETTQFTWRGTWQTSTGYAVNDLFEYNGSVYQVLQAHTSDPSSFNPAATLGGNPIYAHWLDAPTNSLPLGGSTGQVLTKASGSDLDVVWQDAGAGLPVGGSAGFGLFKNSGTNYDVSWKSAALTTYVTHFDKDLLVWDDGLQTWVNKAIGFNTFSISGSTYTISMSDANAIPSWIEMVTAGTMTITINPQSTTPVFSGTEFRFRVLNNVGLIQFTLGAGVTMSKPTGKLAKTRGFAGDMITLKRTTTSNQWFVSGDLANDPNALSNNGGVSIDPGGSKFFTVTPAGNISLTALSCNLDEFTLIVTTSGTTSYTITFSTGFKSTGTLATGTVSGKKFAIRFVGDGTDWLEVWRTAAL